ncbi:non-hydrolyzing UDP-N-acetylglucosamine 2-epimerase [Robiginitomaculum antarcticum]|uniref:non-hydrolyzing UDP-N-acetylglucosamine 2-epimerase n=1 Tax=Robiginitomaculum antarcticum TaxID=437507 RepID=UPI00035D740B|nr:UDP-N-acetylglucosamine 2-epimerase (non-hydrolyzing) [Robiginitomaculum antarcticum]
MKKIVTIVGARPQFVKAAILRRLFDQHPDFEEILVHTGQHYDEKMSDVFFEELEIRPPEYHFDINGKSHGAMTGEMLAAIEEVLLKEKPDALLAYGDTNSTIAGSLAAAKLHIPVFHVEAGLRSFNKKMPEEINRIMTDHMSDLLFCSTDAGVENLQNENITQGVHHVGDIMYDAVLHMQRTTESVTSIQGIDLTDGPIAACTLHRAENTDDKVRLKEIIEVLNGFADDYTIVLPLHPRTKNAVAAHGLDFGKIKTIDPVGYREMQALLSKSDMVFTDSGGLQKEAYFHGKPCVTLRDETEWVELIDNGWNRLWTQDSYKPRKPIEQYGDGDTGERIVAILEAFFKNR